MAMTYDKPTLIPRWADTGTKAEPDEAKKDTGWIVDERPPAQWENWKSNLIGSWFKWLDERFEDGSTKNYLRLNVPLLPSADHASQLGGISDAWGELHVDRVFAEYMPYLYGQAYTEVQGDQTVTTSGIYVGPAVSLLANDIELTPGFYLTTFIYPGVYLINASFTVGGASAAGMNAYFQLEVNGTPVSNTQIYFQISNGSDDLVVGCSWIVSISGDKELKIFAKHGTTGQTFDVRWESKIAITPISVQPLPS